MSAPLRVLEVLATLKRAGAENVATSLACRLDSRRFQTAVVSLYDAFPGGFEPVLAEAGVPVRHLGKRPGFDVTMYRKLWRVLREWRPAVVHTHSYILRYVIPAALASGAARIVHTVHNVAEREVDRLGRAIHYAAFRAGVRAVAIGAEVERSFWRLYGLAPAAVIPNGIDTELFARARLERAAWRARHGFDESDVLFVSVARLDPQKDPLALVEAFASGPGAGGRSHLLLAGNGELTPVLQARSAERVHLLGSRTDVPQLLGACDVFALASRYEGNPVAVMEAMAAGLAVVATRVGGIPELVSDGETGLLVPPGDRAALSSALARAAADGPLRVQLGAAAARKAADFDLAAMVEAYGDLFERAAGRRS